MLAATRSASLMLAALLLLSACKEQKTREVRLGAHLHARVPGDWDCAEEPGTSPVLHCRRGAPPLSIRWSVWKLDEPRPIEALLAATTSDPSRTPARELSIGGTRGLLARSGSRASFVGWRGEGAEKIRLAVTAEVGAEADLALFEELLETTRLEALPAPATSGSVRTPSGIPLRPEPRSVETLFESASAGPAALAVDESHVYFSNECEGRVLRIGHGGGPAEIVAEGLVRPTRIALDASHVYWLDEGHFAEPIACPEGHSACGTELVRRKRDGAVLRRAKTGGEPERVVQGLEYPRDLLLAKSSLFVLLRGDPPRVIEYDLSGRPRRTLIAAGELAARLALVGDVLYSSPPVTVAGPPGAPLTGDRIHASSIAARDGELYALFGAVQRLDAGGHLDHPLSPEVLQPGTALWVDESRVWFSHCGQISGVSREGSGGVTIARTPDVRCEKQANGSTRGGGRDPVSIATSEKHVYWLSRNEPFLETGERFVCKVPGGVYRAAKEREIPGSTAR